MIAKLLPHDVKPVKPPTKAHVTHNEHHPVQPPPPDQPSLVYTKDQTESYQEHVNRVSMLRKLGDDGGEEALIKWRDMAAARSSEGIFLCSRASVPVRGSAECHAGKDG
jgi:hypothetical protein